MKENMKILTFCLSLMALSCVVLAGCGNQASEPQPVPATTTNNRTPTPTRVANPAPELRAVELSHDGTLVAVGTLTQSSPMTGTVTLRQASDNRMVRTWTVTGGVTSLSIARDNKLLAAAGPNKVSLFRLPSGQLLHTRVANGRGSYTVTCDLSPDGKLLAVSDGEFNLIDVKRWKPATRPNIRWGRPGFVDSVTFSPDGKFLATTHHDIGPSLKLRDMRTGQGQSLQNGDAGNNPVFSNDSRYVTGQSEFETSVYHTAPARLARLMEEVDREQGDFGTTFVPYAFSPDGRLLAGGNMTTDHIEIWDVRRGKKLRTLPQTKPVVAWREARTLLVHDKQGLLERVRF